MSHALISCLAVIAVAAWSVDCKPLLLLDHWDDTNIPERDFDSSEEFDVQPQFTGDSSEMTGVLVPKVYVLSFAAEQPSYDSEEDYYLRPAQILPGRRVYNRDMPNSDVDYIDRDHEENFGRGSIGGMWQSPLEEFPDFYTRGQAPVKENYYEGVGSFQGWRGRTNQRGGGIDQSPIIGHKNLMGFSSRHLHSTPLRTNDRIMRGFTNSKAEPKTDELVDIVAHQSSILPMPTNERIIGELGLVEPSVVPTNEDIMDRLTRLVEPPSVVPTNERIVGGLTNRDVEPKMDELMTSPIRSVSTNERMVSDGLTGKAADAKMEELQMQEVMSFLRGVERKEENDDQLKQTLSEKKEEKSTTERMMSDGLASKAADAKMEELQRQAVASFLQSLILKQKNDDQLKQALSEKKVEKSQIQDLENLKHVPHVIQI